MTQPALPEIPDDKTNVKETIESILVAFILAFIFRAFVVEAFVIPTGSMAPTLLGAHMRFTCPDCGYVFDVNYSSDNGSDDDMRLPPDGFPRTDIYCPNCGYHVAVPARFGPPPRNGGPAPILNPGDANPVNFGDRILVLKYYYLLGPPSRWDVVVFKSPDEPQKYHYQQNFIKRLVGLPGEKLMVLDGDIYIWNATAHNWQIPKDKPRSAQDALWRVVYDNDFYPQKPQRPAPPQFVQPWTPDGVGWDTSKGRTFSFNNPSGTGSLHFDRNANSTTQTLTDYLVYDTGAGYGMFRRPGAIGSPDDDNANPVSDLKLAAYYTRVAGDGPFRLILTRSADVEHTFTAELNHEGIHLIHRTSSGELTAKDISYADARVNPDRPMYVELINVDYRVTLRINDKEVFPPMDYEPNVDWLLDQYHNHSRSQKYPEARIEAESQKCSLTHISLYRDVYYTNRGGSGLITGTPDNPVVLNPGEYFVMGDNSAISKDARYWEDPITLPHEGLKMMDRGRVPEQFMLGKAVFVYWPAGFRISDSLRLSIIPNFGDMRWIH
jgi:signal peptidase I